MTDRVSLSIYGDVERPACLGPMELRSLVEAELVADFHCREGWSRLGERWRGVRLTTLLAPAGAAHAAGYVTVASGEYTAVLNMSKRTMSECCSRSSTKEPRAPDPPGSHDWSDPLSGTAL
jgi:DMSO/TMAO reductase YedYZ molybdopterin-dependent catalytic subunit